MSLNFDSTNNLKRGPRRTRGGKNAGLGTIVTSPRATTTTTRRQRTPSDMASLRLLDALLVYPEITEELRFQWRDEMLGMPQLRTMNMETLASALVLIYLTRGDVNPQSFQNNIDQVMSTFDPGNPTGNISLEERDILIENVLQKQRESILRYIRAVILYREERQLQTEALQQQIQNEQLNAQQEPTEQITIDTQARFR